MAQSVFAAKLFAFAFFLFKFAGSKAPPFITTLNNPSHSYAFTIVAGDAANLS